MWYGLNRSVCDVLTDMRNILKTDYYNRDLLLSLVEEAQCMVNRMEQGLQDLNDIESLKDDISEAKKELKGIRRETKESD